MRSLTISLISPWVGSRINRRVHGKVDCAETFGFVEMDRNSSFLLVRTVKYGNEAEVVRALEEISSKIDEPFTHEAVVAEVVESGMIPTLLAFLSNSRFALFEQFFPHLKSIFSSNLTVQALAIKILHEVVFYGTSDQMSSIILAGGASKLIWLMLTVREGFLAEVVSTFAFIYEKAKDHREDMQKGVINVLWNCNLAHYCDRLKTCKLDHILESLIYSPEVELREKAVKILRFLHPDHVHFLLSSFDNFNLDRRWVSSQISIKSCDCIAKWHAHSKLDENSSRFIITHSEINYSWGTFDHPRVEVKQIALFGDREIYCCNLIHSGLIPFMCRSRDLCFLRKFETIRAS